MTVYLVRHAKAGSRRDWAGPDELRPLSKPGRRQAEALAAELGRRVRLGTTSILSSPFLRCRQTVDPLAATLGLPVDVVEELTEGASLEGARRILDGVGDADAVLCSHGDVVGHLLHHAERHGVVLPDGGVAKGSTWVLELEAGAVVDARYLPAPD